MKSFKTIFSVSAILIILLATVFTIWQIQKSQLINQNASTIIGSPYPQSTFITNLTWDSWSHLITFGNGDNWPSTWGDNGLLYTSWGDGTGFGGSNLSLGLATISGDPFSGNLHGSNLNSNISTPVGWGQSGIKTSGIIMVNGNLYLFARNYDVNGDYRHSRLALSTDHGKTWQWQSWYFSNTFGTPNFVEYGSNYQNGDPNYVYIISQNNNDSYSTNPDIVLARIPKDQITNINSYEYFSGTFSNPAWSKDINQRKSIFHDPNGVERVSMSYNAPLQRYFLVAPQKNNQLGIFDGPNPWGPWQTDYYANNFSVGESYEHSFPTKFISTDGKTMWLLFSGQNGTPYQFTLRKAMLTVSQNLSLSPTPVCGNKSNPPNSSPGWSCTGSWGTKPSSTGYYFPTWFGCYGTNGKDPNDNCIPFCGGISECSGLDGPSCERKIRWFVADEGRFGCNSKVLLTNPSTGKSVVAQVVDAGPSCGAEQTISREIIDMSFDTYSYLGYDSTNYRFTQVNKVDNSTLLGPVQMCSNIPTPTPTTNSGGPAYFVPRAISSSSTPTSTPVSNTIATNSIPTLTPTSTPTPAILSLASPSPIPTIQPTDTPTPIPTDTPTPTVDQTLNETPTDIPSPSDTPTALQIAQRTTPIPTSIPSDTPTSSPPTPTPTQLIAGASTVIFGGTVFFILFIGILLFAIPTTRKRILLLMVKFSFNGDYSTLHKMEPKDAINLSTIEKIYDISIIKEGKKDSPSWLLLTDENGSIEGYFDGEINFTGFAKVKGILHKDAEVPYVTVSAIEKVKTSDQN